MIKLIKAIMIRIVVGTILFKLVTFPLEKRIIYHPTSAFIEKPEIIDGENITFRSEDGLLLDGWIFKNEKARHNILFFHGNAGNLSHRLSFIRKLSSRFPLNIFIFDYRGYGRSEGAPSENGLLMDSRAALKAFHNALNEDDKNNPEDIIYYGRSLGSHFASALAAEITPSGLILEAPLYSAAEMCRFMLGINLGPFMWHSLNTAKALRNLNCPLLIIHGDSDKVIPLTHGQKLHNLSTSENKSITVLKGRGHNDTQEAGNTYWRSWQQFLSSLPSESISSP